MDILTKTIDGILKTADKWYKEGWMLYALIGLVLLIGYAIWKG